MSWLGNILAEALRYLLGCRDEAETAAERNRRMAERQLRYRREMSAAEYQELDRKVREGQDTEGWVMSIRSSPSVGHPHWCLSPPKERKIDIEYEKLGQNDLASSPFRDFPKDSSFL